MKANAAYLFAKIALPQVRRLDRTLLNCRAGVGSGGGDGGFAVGGVVGSDGVGVDRRRKRWLFLEFDADFETRPAGAAQRRLRRRGRERWVFVEVAAPLEHLLAIPHHFRSISIHFFQLNCCTGPSQDSQVMLPAFCLLALVDVSQLFPFTERVISVVFLILNHSLFVTTILFDCFTTLQKTRISGSCSASRWLKANCINLSDSYDIWRSVFANQPLAMRVSPVDMA